MSSKAERSGSSPSLRWEHSLNQRTIKATRDRRQKSFGTMDKAVKSESRRERTERFLQEREEEDRVRLQREQAIQHGLQHAIQRLLDRFVTPEEAEDIFRNERVIDSCITSEGTQITITFVDFTPPKSKNPSYT